MNNKKFGVAILIILFLALIYNVNAFELTSTELTKEVCPSSTVLFTAGVSGTGTFNVNYDGSASSFATVVPQGFYLSNGQRTIYIYVTPRLNTAQGNYKLNLVVNSGEIKTLTYNINVQNCNKVNIEGDISREFCACNSESYEYNIINSGNYDETYKVKVTGNGAQYVTLSEEQFTLKSKNSKKIIAYYDAPCGSYGTYNFNINVESLTSNAAASFASNSKINSCYDFNLVPEKTFLDMCEHTIQKIPITIDNTADAQNEFNLALTGPAWANFEKTSLKLNANSKEDVNLLLNPDYKVEGSYNVNIKVSNKEGKLTKNELIKVNVRKCNDVLVDIEKTEDTICNIASKSYDVMVKNTGEVDKEFKVSSNLEWAEIDQNSFLLNAGETKNLKLTLTPNKELTGEHELKLKIESLDSSKIFNEDSLKLNLVNLDLCYIPVIEANNIDLKPDTTATVEVKVTNNGPEKADYILGISGTASGFVQLNPGTLEVMPGRTEVVYLYAAPPFNAKYDIYDLEVSARVSGSDILESKKIQIKVSEAGIMGEERKEKEENKIISLWNKLIAWLRSSISVQQQNLTIEEETEQFNITERENITEEVKIQEPELINKTAAEEKLALLNEMNVISEDIKFNFKDEIHEIKIKEVSNTSVVLEINSEKQFFILDLNETEKADLDMDGYYDLELGLKNVINNKPEISIKEINEKYEEELAPSSEVKSKDYLKSLISLLLAYKFYIILGIIILIVLILIISYWKEIVDFFEEEDTKK